ncbi:hypothetical protein F0562_005572 [Nyssa sinensis]|uniref:RING-type E3 ubiquitin transferase n=1 Tax=Nyssa sinensis TaxID=561372 RepID=A0A5J5AKN4_9ASTE|nr:hypothetical protein F0562_005572 [Nyssa sinensis]
MTFHHRKLLQKTNPYNTTRTVQFRRYETCCFPTCPEVCSLPLPPLPPPPPPPPLFPDFDESQQSNRMSSILILMFCILGAAFGLFCYLTIVKYYSNWSNSRRRNSPTFDDTHEDFMDENRGPVLDNPIWYIHTVGLQQSVIDSIAVFRYKRDEGMIEGTDCSVCLNEFQEDENLRLLPKCSHAFHIPCIDTWLSSHKNCPLCRAPVVSDANNAGMSAVEPNLSDTGLREETRVENLENYGGLGSHQVGGGGGGTSEMRVELSIEEENIVENLEKNSRYFIGRNCESRVLSDLADHRLKVEEELQPMRRSISMDSSSASKIYLAVANIATVENEGCSDSQLVEVEKLNTEIVAKQVRRNSSMYRLMKSRSIRGPLDKGPVSMKRSASFTGKFSLPSASHRIASNVNV